jgi:hypothetical protein
VLGFGMLPASCFYLFGSTFSSEGRTMIEKTPLSLGTPGSLRFAAAPGKRYRVSVDFAFRPEGFPVENAAYVLDYDFPVAYTLADAHGQPVQQLEGQVKKGEPEVREHGTSTEVLGDVIVQRWFPWFTVPESGIMKVDMRVEADRLGKVKLRGATLEVWDDSVREARRGFWAMGVSALVFLCGLGLMLTGQARAQSRVKRG